ncbi:MAG: hypothetical protein LBU65_07335 [Planctomycetaceae bacterium]|jgi:hypothetical protein|nr:hypothetical protein [Planctomycetaceae bacterium]
MKRRKTNTGNVEEGQDSFLDVISNMVGILIILVMIAGVRASQSNANVTIPPELLADSETIQELENIYGNVDEQSAGLQKLRGEIYEKEGIISDIVTKLNIEQSENADLVTELAEIKFDIDQKREKLNEQERERYNINLQTSLAASEREQLEQQLKRLQENEKQSTTVIENKPLPLSREVEGKEAHFRLLGNKVSYVPLDQLIERMRTDVLTNLKTLRNQETYRSVVGPIGDYMLSYSGLVYDTLPPSGGVGRRFDLDHAVVTPNKELVGEDVETAMQHGSDMRIQISQHLPSVYTITFWVYPDSFESYRKLSKFLYEKGYKVAARPLEYNAPIGISPKGTKSNAQ